MLRLRHPTEHLQLQPVYLRQQVAGRMVWSLPILRSEYRVHLFPPVMSVQGPSKTGTFCTEQP